MRARKHDEIECEAQPIARLEVEIDVSNSGYSTVGALSAVAIDIAVTT